MADRFKRQVRNGYWLGWVALGALVVTLLYLDNGLDSGSAIVAGVLLSLLYALICRSTSYMCTSLSLSKTRIPRLVSVYFSSSLAAAGIWVLIALGLGRIVPSWNDGLESKADLLFGLGVALYLFSVAYHYTANAMFRTRQAVRAAEQSRTLAKEAELRALRAQVDPHFLFNSLNSIAALTLESAERSRQMCLQLAEFLRSTQQLGALDKITLGQELQLVRQYLAIEERRFSNRMRVHLKVDEKCMERFIPALLLQPLVENALRHGVGTLRKDAWIELEADCDGRMLCVSLSNRYDPMAARVGGTGRGTNLVRDRLLAQFGNDALMQQTSENGIWKVQLQIPSMDDYIQP